MKKILCLLLVLLMCSQICFAAYTVNDAYDDIKEDHSDFVTAIEGQGVKKSNLISFFEAVCNYMKDMNKTQKITKTNFEGKALTAINRIIAQSKYATLQDAVITLYPEAVSQAISNGTVHPQFKPLVDTIKKIVFDNDMLADDDGDDGGGFSGGGSDEEDTKEITSIKTLSETVKKGSEYKLPATLIALTKDGKEVSVNISWRASVNVSQAGEYKVQGIVTLPKGYSFAKNMSNSIEYTITVTDNYVGKNEFLDVPKEYWGNEAITYLADNFIISGYLDGTYKPEKNITRAEFAKVIVSAMKKLDVDATEEFSDINSEDWYAQYVASAYKNGYITGYPDGTFRPNDSISRADLCTIIYRCIKNTVKTDVSYTVFEDDNVIPDYAKEGIYALSSNKIVNGMGDGCFSPNSYATRAQAAKIIYLALFAN